MSEFTIGQEIVVAHPFVRDTFTVNEGDGDGWTSYERPCWKPGCRTEMIPPDDCEAVADAMGSQILTIVDIHKPGRFPERVFYTRRWRDPDGKEFGKGGLRIKTTQAFRWLARGYRYEFRLETIMSVHSSGRDPVQKGS
jgi:hypothetical protein